MEFPSSGNVIAFRHALYNFAILDEQKDKSINAVVQPLSPQEQPQKVSEKGGDIVKVSITKEQVVQRAMVKFLTPDGRKIAMRLHANVSDGKRLRIKKLNLIVVVSVEG